MNTKFAGETPENTHSYRHHELFSQFRLDLRNPAMETDNCGENSPPLWKNGGPIPQKSPSHPLLGRHRHRGSSSSDSRAEAIARGQWELMEMVRNMPESYYELSLRDLVEAQQDMVKDGTVEENRELDLPQRAVVKLNRSSRAESRKFISDIRIGGFETRVLFLNTVFPFLVRGEKRRKQPKVKKYGGDNFSSSKVSPRIDELKGSTNRDVDWWKKRFTRSSDTNSSRTSGGGGSCTSTTTVSSGGGGGAGGRKRRGLLTGCWPFFCSGRKSKFD